MSSRKHKRYAPQAYESAKGTGDTCAQIYESMLTHPAFLGLTYRQRFLYTACKAQLYGKRKPRNTEGYREIPELCRDEAFFFGADDAEKYGLSTESNHRDFYRDMKALINAGFIDKLVEGSRGRWRAVYRLSSRWQQPP